MGAVEGTYAQTLVIPLLAPQSGILGFNELSDQSSNCYLKKYINLVDINLQERQYYFSYKFKT